MTMNRRTVLGLISAGMVLPASVLQAQENAARIEREIAEATRRKQPWLVPAGVTMVGNIRLPDGAHLIGRRGQSRLVLAGDGPMFRAERAARITFEGVFFDGSGRSASRDAGLLHMREVQDLRLQDCSIERFGGNGISLQNCGGRITGNRFHDHGRAAVFALDSKGLSIDANVVERCGENGLMVWRSAKGEDGTVVRGNRIQDIRADAGGSGEYGNAIGLFRAGGVIAEANIIRRVAYTGVRNNSGSNVTVANNNIASCGEVALYAEFAFDGTVISGNTVDGAWNGIEVTNFADHGGRIAAVTGNVIRNIRRGRHPWNKEIGGGKGIFVEGDAAISGNIVENADQTGLQLGWGPSLRDVTATGNTIRGCGNGIEISVAPGAGHATVIGNRIAGSRQHAIVGKQWLKVATGDLAITGARDWAKIKLADNVTG
ncbi:MAG: TIGR03808 family TAT-translocated repetitive protein [Beijerinckiaceae bacterium]